MAFLSNICKKAWKWSKLVLRGVPFWRTLLRAFSVNQNNLAWPVIYIHIYIYRERERDREHFFSAALLQNLRHTVKFAKFKLWLSVLLGHLAGCKFFQNGHSEAQSESDAMMFYADVSSVGSCQALHSLHPLPFLSVQGMGASNQGDCHAQDWLRRFYT